MWGGRWRSIRCARTTAPNSVELFARNCYVQRLRMAQHRTVKPQHHQKVSHVRGMLTSGACRVVTSGKILTLARFADKLRGRCGEQRTQKCIRPSTTTCHDTMQTPILARCMRRRIRWVRTTIPHLQRPLQHLNATETRHTVLTFSTPCACSYVTFAGPWRSNQSKCRGRTKIGTK